jgi:hypothetical protein
LTPPRAHRLAPAATRCGPRLRGLHPREAAFDAEQLFTALHAAPLFGFVSSRPSLPSVDRILLAISAPDVSLATPSLSRSRVEPVLSVSSEKSLAFASPLSPACSSFRAFLQISVLVTPAHRPLPCDESVRDSSPIARLPSRPSILPEPAQFGFPNPRAHHAGVLTRARYLQGDFTFTTLSPLSFPNGDFVLTGLSTGFPFDPPIPRLSHRAVAPRDEFVPRVSDRAVARPISSSSRRCPPHSAP